MSFVCLFLLTVAACFFISAVCGIVRFFLDVRKYSSYKSELDTLIDRYNKLVPDEIEEAQNDV